MGKTYGFVTLQIFGAHKQATVCLLKELVEDLKLKKGDKFLLTTDGKKIVLEKN